jgi:hypothetical protein
MIPRTATPLAGIAIFAAMSVPACALELASPDGRVRALIALQGGQLGYRILLDGQEVVARSLLGLATNVGDFTSHLQIAAETAPADVRATYDLPMGKASHVDRPGREATITLRSATGTRLDVKFRLADDGLAFAYRFSNDAGSAAGDAPIIIRREATSFALPAGSTAFLHPMAVAKSGWMRTQPSYEEHYAIDQPVGRPAPLGQGWCLPALFKVADRGWVLVGETGVSANSCGARLAQDSAGGVYRIDLPQQQEQLSSDPVEPRVAAGAWLPWRFVVVGKTLAPIVETTMPTDLVEPLYPPESPPRPGRAAWSWLPLKDDNITEPVQRRFIDMAAELRFEYVLVDNWWDQKIGREKIEELAEYARAKGVGLILWYNSNGSWNDAPQTPQDRMDTPEARAEEMAWLRRIGIKGIKVDFFGGDKQSVMQLYDAILRDAAQAGLAVNFHGATIPRGWDRMYPNFVTCEAVRGMEFCTFEQPNADQEPVHATVLPFTRNAIGPMDFTPLMVGPRLGPGDSGPRRRTSLAFEFALPVLFYSAVQHFGLEPDDLDRLPPGAIDFLRELPTVWDETRFLDGYPGKYAVLARRKGDRWYVAAINGQEAPQTVTIPADLAASWTILRDDGENRVVVEPWSATNADGALSLELPARGGAVLRSP